MKRESQITELCQGIKPWKIHLAKNCEGLFYFCFLIPARRYKLYLFTQGEKNCVAIQPISLGGKKDAVTKMPEQFFTVYPGMLEVFGKAKSVRGLSTKLIYRERVESSWARLRHACEAWLACVRLSPTEINEIIPKNQFESGNQGLVAGRAVRLINSSRFLITVLS